MNKYTIFCTEEQTKKALELGAPIVTRWDYDDGNPTPFEEEVSIGFRHYAKNPTAEEMIGWLKEHYYLSFDIYQPRLSWSCSVKHKDKECVFLDSLDSRKEATLSAINAAFDYLSKKI